MIMGSSTIGFLVWQILKHAFVHLKWFYVISPTDVSPTDILPIRPEMTFRKLTFRQPTFCQLGQKRHFTNWHFAKYVIFAIIWVDDSVKLSFIECHLWGISWQNVAVGEMSVGERSPAITSWQNEAISFILHWRHYLHKVSPATISF